MGTIIVVFSKKYMKGSALYYKFFWNIAMLLLSVILMSISDNLILFLMVWIWCNWLMTHLMVHDSTWKAAKASGKLAFQNFTLGFCFLGIGFSFLAQATESFSIHYINHHPENSLGMMVALVMILMGAMTQSAIWPFHSWLISSLNSPTPVSAMMHAGIVNGGGFLLVRFAPLYLNAPKMLDIIFVIGFLSSLLGSSWKLMQHDIKRMLACSTMGQMGFMLVQCGLGLFSSAMAHLCWHGMFKAYLFLSSGNAAQEKRVDLGYPPRLVCFFCSLVCGAWGSYIFSVLNHIRWVTLSTSFIPVGIVFVTGTQLALMVLRNKPIRTLFFGMTLTTGMALVYGTNVYVFDRILSSLYLVNPRPLNLLHFSIFLLLGLAWVFVVFVQSTNSQCELPNWILSLYVKMLNISQPHPSTITVQHNGYKLGVRKS